MRITVVIPYYNEAEFLPGTLRSWLAQTRLPDRLILVDNGSTDGSAQRARETLAGCPVAEILHLSDPRPGKLNALETGCAALDGDLVAFADADIEYPESYLAKAEALLAAAPGKVVSAMALYLHAPPRSLPALGYRLVMPLLSRLFPTKCLTGGGGQIFRVEAFRRAGGFSTRTWKYVLLDHEIMHRMFKQGTSVYHPDFWCRHTNRRGDRKRVRWNVWERFLYLYMPPRGLDWFFYRFLGPRLEARKMSQLNLREQAWRARPGAPRPC